MTSTERKVKTCLNIDPALRDALKEKGVQLTNLVNAILPTVVDQPIVYALSCFNKRERMRKELQRVEDGMERARAEMTALHLSIGELERESTKTLGTSLDAFFYQLSNPIMEGGPRHEEYLDLVEDLRTWLPQVIDRWERSGKRKYGVTTLAHVAKERAENRGLHKSAAVKAVKQLVEEGVILLGAEM